MSHDPSISALIHAFTNLQPVKPSRGVIVAGGRTWAIDDLRLAADSDVPEREILHVLLDAYERSEEDKLRAQLKRLNEQLTEQADTLKRVRQELEKLGKGDLPSAVKQVVDALYGEVCSIA